MRYAILALLLTGCAGNPLTRDDAVLSLAVPNGATDCQYRVTEADTRGEGLFVDGGFKTRIVTFIGPQNCPPGLTVDVPTTRPVQLGTPREDAILLELERIRAQLPARPE